MITVSCRHKTIAVTLQNQHNVIQHGHSCSVVVFLSRSLPQLTVFGTEGRNLEWPRLLHSANSSQLDVWFDGVPARAARSRFLLELAAVAGANPPSQAEVRRSIDDEFTPSIFKVVN